MKPNVRHRDKLLIHRIISTNLPLSLHLSLHFPFQNFSYKSLIAQIKYSHKYFKIHPKRYS